MVANESTAKHKKDDVFDYNDCIRLDTYDDQNVEPLHDDLIARMRRATQLTNFDPITPEDMKLKFFKKVTSITFVLTFFNNFGLLQYLPDRVNVIHFGCDMSRHDLTTIKHVATKTVTMSVDFALTLHRDWVKPKYVRIKQLTNFWPRTIGHMRLTYYPDVKSVKFSDEFIDKEDWLDQYLPSRVVDVTFGYGFQLPHLPKEMHPAFTTLELGETFEDGLTATQFSKMPNLLTLKLNVNYPLSTDKNELPLGLNVLQFMPQLMPRMRNDILAGKSDKNRHFVGSDSSTDAPSGYKLTPNIRSLVVDWDDTLDAFIGNDPNITVHRHDLHPTQRITERGVELRTKHINLSRAIADDNKNYRILQFFRDSEIVHAKKIQQKQLLAEYETIMSKISTYETLSKKKEESFIRAKKAWMVLATQTGS